MNVSGASTSEDWVMEEYTMGVRGSAEDVDTGSCVVVVGSSDLGVVILGRLL